MIKAVSFTQVSGFGLTGTFAPRSSKHTSQAHRCKYRSFVLLFFKVKSFRKDTSTPFRQMKGLWREFYELRKGEQAWCPWLQVFHRGSLLQNRHAHTLLSSVLVYKPVWFGTACLPHGTSSLFRNLVGSSGHEADFLSVPHWRWRLKALFLKWDIKNTSCRTISSYILQKCPWGTKEQTDLKLPGV